jgi:uncharacterized protein YqhQ
MNFTQLIKKITLLPFQFFLMAPKKNTIGGQAIIEGVMMRGKNKISWAIRKGPMEIIVEDKPFLSLCRKHKYLNIPIVRGAINLYESLVIGYAALSRSADVYTEVEEQKNVNQKPKSKNRTTEQLSSIFSLGIGLIISFGVFMYLPMWILSQFVSKESAILFNTLAIIIRIIFFLTYLILISMWKDIRRVFEYHGAEHKAIFAFEDGKQLTLENMRPYTTLHPRCGTSFLLLVGLFCVLLFSIVDALFIGFIGPYPSTFIRFLVHIALIPLVSGTSYEALKLSDRYQHFPLVNLIIQPGLWLQKITTRNPDDSQLETASLALKAAL